MAVDKEGLAYAALLIGGTSFVGGGVTSCVQNPYPKFKETPEYVAAHEIAKQPGANSLTPAEYGVLNVKEIKKEIKRREDAERKVVDERNADLGRNMLIGIAGETALIGGGLGAAALVRRRREEEEKRKKENTGNAR